MVATRFQIKDAYAKAFSLGFYERIFQRRTVWQAFEEGMLAVKVEFPDRFLREDPDGQPLYLSNQIALLTPFAALTTRTHARTTTHNTLP